MIEMQVQETETLRWIHSLPHFPTSQWGMAFLARDRSYLEKLAVCLNVVNIDVAEKMYLCLVNTEILSQIQSISVQKFEFKCGLGTSSLFILKSKGPVIWMNVPGTFQRNLSVMFFHGATDHRLGLTDKPTVLVRLESNYISVWFLVSVERSSILELNFLHAISTRFHFNEHRELLCIDRYWKSWLRNVAATNAR